ncbi:MAG: hypothetical protein BWY82_01747 [Verrucomicrobia bacterium ADurb.Bin474]|nr:MAG: hypothetical protein BWY82_01747 [Verrucomicrobia bacterium ADurb.Bin474]
MITINPFRKACSITHSTLSKNAGSIVYGSVAKAWADQRMGTLTERNPLEATSLK